MHEINYWVREKDCDKKKVMAEIVSFAERNGDGYGGSDVKWHDGTVYESEDDAMSAIKLYDNGWYDDHAVLFKDYDVNDVSKKQKEYEQKIQKLRDEKREYIKNNSVMMRKSEMIGCGNCGSKIAKKFLRGDFCPVCGKDLRSETVQKKTRWFDEKIDAISAQAKEEGKKSGKYKVKWLIKFEYHC